MAQNDQNTIVKCFEVYNIYTYIMWYPRMISNWIFLFSDPRNADLCMRLRSRLRFCVMLVYTSKNKYIYILD